MRVIYLPLEPYRERYTELLTGWTINRWKDKVDLEVVEGTKLSDGIATGQVLDAHGRSYWSLTQMANLVSLLRLKPPGRRDVIYLDDMFTPGYEALPYIFEQSPWENRPRIYARNHAQSIDPDDFTFPMRGWMRPYEKLVYRTARGIICASTVHKEMMEAAGLDACPIRVLGLPYDAEAVRALGPSVLPDFHGRPRRVVYSSRLDREKQPHFFFDIVERVAGMSTEFVICTGAAQPRSNDPSVLERLEDLKNRGLVRVAAGLSKEGYYRTLARARVQINTARQDFVSYTAIEASTFGTATLAPAFRSFPETFRNRSMNLYAPWCLEDAVEKLLRLLTTPDPEVDKLSKFQHGTLDRILNLFYAGDL